MSTPTLAKALSPILADMRIKAANLRQGAPRIAEFADVADWIDGWELAIATAAQNVGTSTPETATPEPTGPERVTPLGGSRVSAMPILALWLETTADACEGEPNSDAFNLRTSATLLRSLHAERDDAIAACERLQQRVRELEEDGKRLDFVEEKSNGTGDSVVLGGACTWGVCLRQGRYGADRVIGTGEDLRAALDDARAKFNEVSERNGFPERDRLQQRVKELDEDRALLDWLDTLPCGISILGDRDFPQAMGMTPKAPGHSHTRQLIRECRAARAQEGKEMTESKYTARYTLQDNTLEQAERSALCDRQRIIARAEEKGTLDTGACESCTPADGDCLNAGCNRAAPDSIVQLREMLRLLTTPISPFEINWPETRKNAYALLEQLAVEVGRLQQRVRELEVMRSTVRPRIERLLAQCGFATPMILRILDPVFGDGPADHGADFAARKHPDCVAVMCGKVDCRSSGPCYTLVHPRAEEMFPDA